MRQHGITLLELLITVAIIGILAAIAAPSMKQFIDKSRLAGGAQGVYNQLQYARSIATSRNTNVTVVVNDDSGGNDWCIGVTTLSSCDCSTPSSCVVATESGLNDTAVRLVGSQYPSISITPTVPNWVILVPRNTVSAASEPQVLVTHPDLSGTTRVQVNVLGRVKVCSDTLGQYNDC